MDDWSLIDKWFQLIREVLPQAKKVALMACNNKYKPSWEWCHRSAQRSGLELVEARLNSPVSPEEVTRVFARLREQCAAALTASGQPEIWAQSDRLIRLTEEARYPMVHLLDGMAELGALMVQSPALGPEVSYNERLRRQGPQRGTTGRPSNLPYGSSDTARKPEDRESFGNCHA